MSGSQSPTQYSVVPTAALWTWSAPVSGQAQTVISYPAAGGAATGSLTKSGVTPQDLADFLGIPLQTYGAGGAPIADAVVNRWIRYAEDEIETETNVRLCQTWIAAPAAKTSYQVSATGLGVQDKYQQLGIDYDYTEAAYDFFFNRAQDEGWLYQRMRWRPVKSIELVSGASEFDQTNLTGVKNQAFIYPLLNEFFRMPISWMVEDQNRGLIRGVPSTNVQMLPLFAMQLAFMGFAETVPGGLWYQYTAGLTANDYQANWAFMKQLVLARAGIRALRGMQLSVNLGAIETLTQADGLQYRTRYSEKGAFWGQIQELQAEDKTLVKRAKMMGGGLNLGML